MFGYQPVVQLVKPNYINGENDYKNSKYLIGGTNHEKVPDNASVPNVAAFHIGV